uniref:TIL domain-containing protein n=2 Tax=Caenorhabditis tropicalis TaxID=1561998 RepID=A0A1I7TPT3_9PELO
MYRQNILVIQLGMLIYLPVSDSCMATYPVDSPAVSGPTTSISTLNTATSPVHTISNNAFSNSKTMDTSSFNTTSNFNSSSISNQNMEISSNLNSVSNCSDLVNGVCSGLGSLNSSFSGSIFMLESRPNAVLNYSRFNTISNLNKNVSDIKEASNLTHSNQNNLTSSSHSMSGSNNSNSNNNVVNNYISVYGNNGSSGGNGEETGGGGGNGNGGGGNGGNGDGGGGGVEYDGPHSGCRHCDCGCRRIKNCSKQRRRHLKERKLKLIMSSSESWESTEESSISCCCRRRKRIFSGCGGVYSKYPKFSHYPTSQVLLVGVDAHFVRRIFPSCWSCIQSSHEYRNGFHRAVRSSRSSFCESSSSEKNRQHGKRTRCESGCKKNVLTCPVYEGECVGCCEVPNHCCFGKEKRRCRRRKTTSSSILTTTTQTTRKPTTTVTTETTASANTLTSSIFRTTTDKMDSSSTDIIAASTDIFFISTETQTSTEFPLSTASHVSSTIEILPPTPKNEQTLSTTEMTISSSTTRDTTSELRTFSIEVIEEHPTVEDVSTTKHGVSWVTG